MSRKKKQQHNNHRVEIMISVREPVPHNCLCERPHAKIICRNCGGSFKGRIRLHCPVHLNVCRINSIQNFLHISVNMLDKCLHEEQILTIAFPKFIESMIMFLNDISQCPTCKANSEYLLEYNT